MLSLPYRRIFTKHIPFLWRKIPSTLTKNKIRISFEPVRLITDSIKLVRQKNGKTLEMKLIIKKAQNHLTVKAAYLYTYTYIGNRPFFQSDDFKSYFFGVFPNKNL